MTLNLKNPLAFFDLEATGVDTVNDRIVEIAIIKILPNGEREERTRRINPTIPIPEEVTKIHGISNEDIKDEPTFKQIGKSLADFLKGCDLAGFNILHYDVPLLVEEFLRADIDFDVSNRRLIDLQKIYHLMEPRTLSAAYRFYCDKNLENAHSAYADTEACLHILEQQVQRYEGEEVFDKKGNMLTTVSNDMDALHKLSFSNKLDLAGRIVYDDKKTPVFNFGKYRNRPVKEVLDKDPSYYNWMMKGDFPRNTKQVLTRLKLGDLIRKK
ncbi:MAG: 3'-5' exonuclease [Bernardetiaceae bacterium]|nr:3'-5' exonuclease [Bernardetiaceae bacterium]